MKTVAKMAERATLFDNII